MKAILETLRPQPEVLELLDQASPILTETAAQIGIGKRTLATQLVLHIPFHSAEEIVLDPNDVTQTALGKAAIVGEDLSSHYKMLQEGSDQKAAGNTSSIKGKKMLEIIREDGETVPVRFGTVENEVAEMIDGRLHYIRTSRPDNLVTYGLYMGTGELPYASVSFSACKRSYQADALNAAASLNLAAGSVLAMTRAFALDGAPKNSMSKLFHLSIEQIKADFPSFDAVVTALNPYLGFEGGVFTGASFEPYALSPLEYWYDEAGFYVPRSKGVRPQELVTPPILWLSRGLNRQTAQAIDSLSARNTLVQIESEDYKLG